MPAFNRTFFDLNHERQYILTNHHEDVPPGVIADLKLSLKADDKLPAITGILCKDNIIRVSIAIDNSAIAYFSSDNRMDLKRGRAYAVNGISGEYSGFIVFGSGAFQETVDFKGYAEISEECLSRIVPSSIPYVSIPCTNLKLTGNVPISGDGNQSHTFQSLVAERRGRKLFESDRSFMIDLFDTQVRDASNPMIAMANGINSYNDTYEIRSPIYTIQNVTPNDEGTIFIVFVDHFHVSAVVDEIPNTDDVIHVSKAAVESIFVPSDVCSNKNTGDGGGTEDDDCEIEFEIIEPK